MDEQLSRPTAHREGLFIELNKLVDDAGTHAAAAKKAASRWKGVHL